MEEAYCREFQEGCRHLLQRKISSKLNPRSEIPHLADYVLVELVGVLAHDRVVDVVVESCPDLPHATAIVRDGFGLISQAGVKRGTGNEATPNYQLPFWLWGLSRPGNPRPLTALHKLYVAQRGAASGISSRPHTPVITSPDLSVGNLFGAT